MPSYEDLSALVDGEDLQDLESTLGKDAAWNCTHPFSDDDIEEGLIDISNGTRTFMGHGGAGILVANEDDE